MDNGEVFVPWHDWFWYNKMECILYGFIFNVDILLDYLPMKAREPKKFPDIFTLC